MSRVHGGFMMVLSVAITKLNSHNPARMFQLLQWSWRSLIYFVGRKGCSRFALALQEQFQEIRALDSRQRVNLGCEIPGLRVSYSFSGPAELGLSKFFIVTRCSST